MITLTSLKIVFCLLFVVSFVLMSPIMVFANHGCGPSSYTDILSSMLSQSPNMIYNNAISSVVKLDVTRSNGPSSGSGVIFDNCGNIVTNSHVITGAKSVMVTMSDGQTYSAAIIGSDPNNDIAVVQIPSLTINHLNFLDETMPISVGDRVYALGFPLGINGVMSEGIVSNFNSFTPDNAGLGVHPVIIFTATITFGSSGGALLDDNGRLVGITEGLVSNSGYEFAIPPFIVIPSIYKIYDEFNAANCDTFSPSHCYGIQ